MRGKKESKQIPGKVSRAMIILLMTIVPIAVFLLTFLTYIDVITF